MESRAPLLAGLAGLLLALSACTGGGSPDPEGARLAAEELRETSVSSTLDLLRATLDLVAPLSGARDEATLQALADQLGCTLSGPVEGGYDLLCTEPGTVSVTVIFLQDGLPAADPSLADSLEVRLDGLAGTYQVEGVLFLRPEPGSGIVVSGELSASGLGGDLLLAGFDRVTVRTVADLEGLPFAVLFTSGDVDLEVRTADGDQATGTAALVGRRALVALELDGVFTTGEIDLAAGP